MPYFKQSLEIKKKVYGEEHPKVALGLNNLAQLLQDQASFNVMWSVRAVLLSDWPCCWAFGCTQGKLDEAEPLFKQALAIYKKVYGEEHPRVATALNNLAQLLSDQVSRSVVDKNLCC